MGKITSKHRRAHTHTANKNRAVPIHPICHHKHKHKHTRPTDVVVLVPGPELEAQGEGGEELELLREAQGSVRTAGPVALPALEAAHPVLAGGVALVVDHEEDVALHASVGRGTLVERTVDVQVVVDVDRHPVLPVPESANTHTNNTFGL